MRARLLRGLPPDARAVLLLLAASLLFHLPAWTAGLIPMEDDVRVFYFPLLVATSEALARGTLPLWTPSIFGGYPLFADGEAGMLYPLHLLLLPWLTPETSLVALRVVHSALASGFTFLLLRTLGVGTLGSLVGGLVYAYSGFAAGQIVHSNVFHSMVWLPLELLLVERAWRAGGVARYRYAALAGVVFGVQALATHVHITLLSALAVGSFVVYRGVVQSGGWGRPSPPLPNPPPPGGREQGTALTPTLSQRERGVAPAALSEKEWEVASPALSQGGGELASPVLSRREWGLVSPALSQQARVVAFPAHSKATRLRWMGRVVVGGAVAGVMLGIMGAIGVGLGAVQLVPLFELGMQSYRGEGLDRALAATNSVWPGALVSLVLPRLFDTPTGGFWGPWVKWETIIYPGLVPLLLAGVGLGTRSGPYRLYWGVLAVGSLLFALGPNAPVPLWTTVHSLPGFEVLKSPGRFALLFTLAVAALAAYGVDWLSRRESQAPRTAAVVLGIGSLVVVALGAVSAAASAHLPQDAALLDDYLRRPGIPLQVDGAPLTDARVAQLVADGLAVANPATAWQLALLLAAALIIPLWLLGGRARRAAAAATVAVILADFAMLWLTYHPYAPISGLRPQVPAPLLAAQATEPAPFRIFTPPTTLDKLSQVDPNRLLIAGLHEAGGYSSIEPDRHIAYALSVQYADNFLLDLWNVRYLVRRNVGDLLPSYALTSFYPNRPLFSGRRGNAGSGGVLLPDGREARADAVHVIASLWDAEQLADGATVAHITLEGTDGSQQTLRLRAGHHVSDARSDLPGQPHRAQHAAPEVAFQYQRSDPGGLRFGEQLSYGRLPVDPPMVVRRVTIENVAPIGGLEIYGVGLFNAEKGEVTQVRDKAKYHLVHQDTDVRVYENAAAMPRAFLVDHAVVVPAGQALVTMVDSPFDPATTAVVERPLPAGVTLPGAPAPGGEAARSQAVPILSYEAENVVLRVTAEHEAVLVLSDPYFPGWVARVDGHATPIMRADHLFRAVVVPPGTHTVTFAFEPATLALGAMVSVVAFVLVLALALGHGLVAVRGRLPALRRTPATAVPEVPPSTAPGLS